MRVAYVSRLSAGAGCYSGAFDSMTTVIAANGGGWSGLTSLYSGFTISCIGIIPFRGTYFGVNDALSSINPYGQERSLRGLFSKFMCAQIAAIAAGAASYPFDTVRRLMQLHAATGHTVSMTEAASISWNEGTLFAGLGANTMRTIVRPLLACCLACCTDSQIKLTWIVTLFAIYIYIYISSPSSL